MAGPTKRNASITLFDGTPTDLLTADDVGDFTADNLQEGNIEAVAIYNRDQFAGMAEGQDVQINLSWSVRLKGETQTDGASARFLDAVLQTGSFAGAVNANPDTDGPFMLGGVRYVITRGGSTLGTFTYSKVRLMVSKDESGETIVYNCTAVCYGGCAVT